ncbi:MICOS subunit Mic26p [[Candida] railenensis]|uniref:MICOS complex subunit n=1 Tax=[Candida] railenensis TaxID=45579 RepID=A0A9P0QRU5_9ASCO|nr:MICOS subunit Mic26p [[Candida] railenensis]
MSRFVKIGSSIVGITAYSMHNSSSTSIYNESSKKRNFYEDDKEIVPVPGTVVPSSGTELQALGQNRLIDGISVRSPASLESFFRSTRESLTSLYTQSLHYLDNGYEKYHKTEEQLTSTVSDLHAKHEDLLPNGIYVIIAALSGNILARQRNIVAKVTFPIFFGLVGFKYFLPETFGRTSNFAWKLEQKNLPQLAEGQTIAVNKSKALVESLENTAVDGQLKLDNGVKSLRKSIADITGLNLDEEVSKK